MNVLMCVNISSKEYNCSSYQDQSLKGVLFLRTQESISRQNFSSAFHFFDMNVFDVCQYKQ